MKKMLAKKLPLSILCWSLVVGMVLFSSPAFSRDSHSSKKSDKYSSKKWDNHSSHRRSNHSYHDRNRSRSHSVRIVHHNSALPAIIATGLIAGIALSLLDNDDGPPPRPAASRYCPTTHRQATVSDTVVVTAQLLNIRTGPGLSEPPVGQIPRGTQLSVMGTAPGWYWVTTPDGLSGWVMAQYTSSSGFPNSG